MNTYQVLVDDVVNGEVRQACDYYDFDNVIAENADEALVKAAMIASNPKCYNFDAPGEYEFQVSVRNVNNPSDKNGTFITVAA